METLFRVVSYDGDYEDVQEFNNIHKARALFINHVDSGDYIEVTLDSIRTNYEDEEDQIIIDSWSK